ncbi:MAG: NUDIX hydrolase [Verrucomicrobiales bacterium]|nr:NUDIX hydrolase [Verrucomicrobiales bacterium]
MTPELNHDVDITDPWVTRSTRIAYENDWIRVDHSEVTNPAGGEGIYGVVHYKNLAVGVIPIDEEDHTWLVGQYRFTSKTYEWEIPEGGCPEGTDLLETAKRELKEETGLEAGQYELILNDLVLSNSVSDERAFIYVARDLTPGPPEQEDTEQITVRRIPLETAFGMVERGEIRDAMSVAGLLKVQTNRVGSSNQPC